MEPSHPCFHRRSLKGRSFKGQNLANADFSQADLRGVDFSGANLTGANFSGAKAGVQDRWKWLLVIGLSLFAGLAAFVTSLAAFWVGLNMIYDLPRLFTAVSFFGLIFVVFLALSLYRELLSAIGFTPLVFTILIFLAGGLTVIGTGYPTAGGSGAGVAAGVIAGSTIAAILLTAVYLIAGLSTTIVALSLTLLGSGTAAWQSYTNELALTVLPNPSASAFSVWLGLQLSLVSGGGIFCLSLYLVWRAIANDTRYQFVQDLAIAIAVLKGTCFRGANLTQANFSQAQLKNCDFRDSIIARTFWYKSDQLNWARFGNSILAIAPVRALLVNGKGAQPSYANANLQGANLSSFDLSHLNLRNADLSGATLRGASLEWSNLTQVQAIGTDFTDTQMTGACGLGTWNIDSSTLLRDVDCRWVYLLEHPKPGTDDRERRPSSGEFEPEEFVNLFRQVIDTIDLIFRNGLDRQAFSQTVQRIQIEHADSQLEIQSIENKGNGIVVVKLRASTAVNKSDVHRQFMQLYQDAIALNHQQTKMLHQHEQAIQAILDRLLGPSIQDQVVVLHIGQGTFEQGFPVTLQILQDGMSLPFVQQVGVLPPNNEILPSYQYWQSAYRRTLKATRLDVPSQVTNVSGADFFSDCLAAAERLSQQMNCWLAAESFQLIERTMHIKLNCDQSIRVILQTDQAELRQLPWQTWQFFEDYPQAEIALSKLSYHTPKLTAIAPRTVKQHVRILAILGDSQGIDLDKDRAALEALDAEVTFLVTPDRQSLSGTLRQHSWDILYFAGHSQSQADCSSGKLWINATEHLAISEIRSALNRAILQGLQLAIFNSCDGLGLANALADLQIPQIIVMREPIADVVAQAFLIGFLKHFSAGQSLYQSVREAREQLQDLKELYPGATWLPIIVQNPAEKSRTWETLKNLNHRVQA